MQEFRKRAQSGQPSNITLVHCRLKSYIKFNVYKSLEVHFMEDEIHLLEFFMTNDE